LLWLTHCKSIELGFLKNKYLLISVTQVASLVIPNNTLAKASLLEMTEFIETFGCGFCLTKLKRTPKGTEAVRIYSDPFDSNAVPQSMRSTEQIVKDVRKATKTKKVV